MIPLAGLIGPKLIAAVVVGSSLVAAGWLARGQIARGQIAELHARHAAAVASAEATARQAVEAARAREAEIINRTEEIVRDARTTVESLRADAVAAVVAADGLRVAAARYAARRCPGPGASAAAAGGGQAAGLPGDMRDADRLLRVLAELDATAGTLADHADRSRAAGLACERAYGAADAALKTAR